MNLKSFAILGALCAAVAAQDTENKFEVNTLFYRQQCGAQKLIANPRLCFKTALDINKEAIQGKGQYDGYSTSDGHGFSVMCSPDYRRMYTKEYWISAIQPRGQKCCVYSVRRNSDNRLMSSGSTCNDNLNQMHTFP